MLVRNTWRRLRRGVIVQEDVRQVHSLMLGAVEIKVERRVELEQGVCSCVVALTVDHRTGPGVHWAPLPVGGKERISFSGNKVQGGGVRDG